MYIIKCKINYSTQIPYQALSIGIFYKLGEIILSLGYINTKFLNIDQKVKFAYLYNKYVHQSLEEIYNLVKNAVLYKEEKEHNDEPTAFNRFLQGDPLGTVSAWSNQDGFILHPKNVSLKRHE